MENKENKNMENGENHNQKIYPHQLPLTTLFVWFMGILNGKAWEDLGLMSNPETKEVKQDLKKAKISIDSIEFLLTQVTNELDIEDKKQIEHMLANLHMNYVEKYQESKKEDQTNKNN